MSSEVIAYLGFILAAYSVIGNDVIQTLGTFIQSNEERPWWHLLLYIGGILSAVLLIGWFINNGDVSYGRLEKIPRPEELSLWYLLPPVLLLIITRFGIPVSTTFLMLSVFSPAVLIEGMLVKSLTGYLIAFSSAILVYAIFLNKFEIGPKANEIEGSKTFWLAFQWLSTAFLWSQWLIQDFANLYVYLPGQLDFGSLLVTLGIILLILGYILATKGGSIQKVVAVKHNSSNIRSASLIDLLYGLVLLFFTSLNKIPMSTTWVFIGILAGREIAIRHALKGNALREGWKMVGWDFLKVTFGVGISVLAVLLMKQANLI